jgi:alpha-D-ribose 1-methylphosphonate 5-phosphate C-P lyase
MTYNFAYLDEQTKRMIRRAILKGARHPRLSGAVRQPRDADALWLGHRRRAGHGRLLTPEDTLKVIDQGADDTTNAVSIRSFFERTAGVATTEATGRGQRHPDPPPHPRDAAAEGQILVYQVPIPEPLRFLEPRETETRKMHALEEYGLMHVKLYEDIAATAISPPPTPIR